MTDLDTRLTTVLQTVADGTTVSDHALEAIIARADERSAGRSTRSVRWITLAGLAGAALAVVVVTIARSDQSSTSPNVATVVIPGFTSATGCGDVDQRAATAAEAVLVSYLPTSLPTGYRLATEPAPGAIVQQRSASSSECWSADATYADSDAGRLLTISVSRQGNDVQRTCQLPPGYLPAECTTIQGQPAALTHGGTRSSLAWISAAGDQISVAGFGFSPDQLAELAGTAAFDGTHASVDTPPGMTQVEDTVKTRTDNREVTYYNAAFTRDGDAADAPSVTLSVTTWNDPSVNEVGPATIVDLDGTPAVAVTTGGSGTGIIGWTRPVDAVGPSDSVEFEQPAHAYITWNHSGITFRIEGPDATTVTQIAEALQPVQ